MKILNILSGGAAFGLVSALQARFTQSTGYEVAGSYSAVGAMRDQLLAGAPCDVLILTAALMAELEQSGHVLAGSTQALGIVKTGIAIKKDDALCTVKNGAELKAALLAANGIYLPHPVKSTAGIHVMKVLAELGIANDVAARLRPYANGASAMAAMAQSDEWGLIGCTQITEIMSTPGTLLVAPLPAAFELATVYAAGVSAKAQAPQAARALVELLSRADVAPMRNACGFEPVSQAPA